MAERMSSPSPSMHTARTRNSAGSPGSVVGTTIDVPTSEPTRRRLFTTPSHNNNNGEQTSTSSVGLSSTPSSPSYMRRKTDKSNLLDMDAVIEDENDQGDGDSVEDSDEMQLLNELASEAERDRLKVLIKQEDDTDDVVLDGEENHLRFDLVDLDDETKLPTIPEGWKPKPPKSELNEPRFEDVDNPGSWPEYTFSPKFVTSGKGKKKKTEYAYHALPTGCTVVPKNDDGLRVIKGWEFHYTEWNSNSADPIVLTSSPW